MNKEPYIFVLNKKDAPKNISPIKIDIWNDIERMGNDLPSEAKSFIELARKEKGVYNLKDFILAFNENDISKEDYAFFTRQY